ncbi:ribose 5-phosphate isomerase B [Spirochaetia bacterium]|nr:ribose 5-phosphate isomerase B [Spirochaetia bacterium]
MIALAGDHGGFLLKEEIKKYLDELKFDYKDFGSATGESCDYPVVSKPAIQAVATGVCEKGILFCGTGVGMSITANKTRGIRCVVCSEPFSAALSREHNNTNMLALGGRVIGVDLAKMIVKIWLTTEFSNVDRHIKRVSLIE